MMMELNTSFVDRYVAIHARIGGRVESSENTLGWDDPLRHPLEDVKLFIECAKQKAQQQNGTSILLFQITSL